MVTNNTTMTAEAAAIVEMKMADLSILEVSSPSHSLLVAVVVGMGPSSDVES